MWTRNNMKAVAVTALGAVFLFCLIGSIIFEVCQHKEDGVAGVGVTADGSLNHNTDKLIELYEGARLESPDLPFELRDECECYEVDKRYTWHDAGKEYMLLELARASPLYGSRYFVRLIAVDITLGGFKKVFDREVLSSHMETHWVLGKKSLSCHTRDGVFAVNLEIADALNKEDDDVSQVGSKTEKGKK